jgi:hypothetical protein
MFAALLERRMQLENYIQFNRDLTAARGDEKSVKKIERSLKPDG